MLKRLKSRFWQSSKVLWIAPAIFGALLLIRDTGWLQPLEWWALDQMFCLHPKEAPDDRIVVVEIREEDVRRLGHPLSDSILAKLLEKIRIQQPVAIGLDLYRDLPVPQDGSQYAKLAAVFQTTPNLFGISKVSGNTKDPVVNPPPILKQKNQVTANDVMVDFDGKVRRGFLYLTDTEDNNVLSLGFQLAVSYLSRHGHSLEVTPQEQLKLDSVVFSPFYRNQGGYVDAEDGGYQVLINYRGDTSKFAHISVSDVLEGRVPQTKFRDRIVLIGSVAESLKDFFYSPYSSDFRSTAESPPQLPGVYYHANLTSHVISSVLDQRPLIRTWPKGVDIAWQILWIGLGIAISWNFRPGGVLRRNYLGIPFLATRRVLLPLSVLGLVGAAYGAFLQGWWIPVVPPLLGLSGSALAVTIYIAHTAEQIRKTFGRYVTDDVVNSLLETPDGMKLGGERRTVSILMSDIRGFSAISERVPPEKVITFLNIYLEIMADVITLYQGTIDEFIGDAILVIFGAPTQRFNDAERAVACAVSMQLAMAEVNARIRALDVPELFMGIAINTGDVVVGNIGSAKRAKYGVVGSHVNLTGRIESFTEAGQILISETTYNAAKAIAQIDQVLPIQPKGFQGTLTVYNVVGVGSPHNLALPKKDKKLQVLAHPLNVIFFRLENKHVVGESQVAQITHLSATYACLQASQPISLMSDLKIYLYELPEMPTPTGDMYGKVVEAHDLSLNAYLVSFTEIPPEVHLIFTKLLSLAEKS